MSHLLPMIMEMAFGDHSNHQGVSINIFTNTLKKPEILRCHLEPLLQSKAVQTQ